MTDNMLPLANLARMLACTLNEWATTVEAEARGEITPLVPVGHVQESVLALFRNGEALTAPSIAQAMNTDQSNVNKTLKALVKRGLLVTDTTIRPTRYLLSPRNI